jgi:hypothetical protein
MASIPDSPVLIRMASSTVETKIFPSPIRPVLFWATAPATAQPNTAAHRDLRLEATLNLTRGLVITRR